MTSQLALDIDHAPRLPTPAAQPTPSIPKPPPDENRRCYGYPYAPHTVAPGKRARNVYPRDVSVWGPWKARKWGSGKIYDSLRGRLAKPWRRAWISRTAAAIPFRVYDAALRGATRSGAWRTRYTKLALRRVDAEHQWYMLELLLTARGWWAEDREPPADIDYTHGRN